MNAIMKKIISYSMQATIAVAIIYAILFMGLTTWLPMFVGVVPTPSMFPEIEQGDMILVDRQVEFENVMIGDVAVFNAPVMIVHRVINVTDDGLSTQGDYNQDPDDITVTEHMYVGIVVHVFEGGLYWSVGILSSIVVWSACNSWRKIKHMRSSPS